MTEQAEVLSGIDDRFPIRCPTLKRLRGTKPGECIHRESND